MNLFENIIAAIVSFLFLTLVFVPMEKVFPAKAKQKFFRPHWLLDTLFFIGQYVIWSGLILWTLNYFNEFLSQIVPQELRTFIKSYPIWVQAIVVIILSDFIIYWGHRLQHNVGFLWRFHKVHHSAEHLDWLAAHREHPIDSIYTVGLINLPAFILGFPLEVIAGVIAFRGIWAIYIHSNVRLPIGPLKILIGAPELHHWHHDLDRDAGNYANISPIMDILFGTYVCPDKEPQHFGIKEPFPKNYVGQMLAPMLPNKIASKFSSRKKDTAV